ncbi:transport and Golgi organization 2 homolog isoform X2 [Cephus cinctus]|uniref:Transport and Golgi organization 2 homolog isoform X2 n=1 Tax=Cephus cinctus TaxID=211228 RepID=A0AAJ7RFD8_CEPCN|nr:transport and Golgi organization 2 homolog isoform X2 [Cephus cinctus]
MCILFVYRNIYANANNYRLIVASNRDENFNRPAVPARFWEKYPHCLGGMDMEPGREGGSWLSLSTKGHAGVLLNLPGETRSTESAGQNRGFLVKDYVTSEMSPESYLNELHLKNQKNQYDPYNLILINLRTAAVYYLNSSENSPGHVVCQDNVIGFGNSLLDTPLKKVEAGKKWFQKIVENVTVSNEESLIEDLIKLLGNREKYILYINVSTGSRVEEEMHQLL